VQGGLKESGQGMAGGSKGDPHTPNEEPIREKKIKFIFQVLEGKLKLLNIFNLWYR
jgi:hypothetical protein